MGLLDFILEPATERNKDKAIRSLIHEGTPNTDFFLMILLSVVAATFGLFLNNVPIIVGSMLIAPILSPVLSISLGLVVLDPRLIFRSVTTVVRSLIVGVGAAAIVATLFYQQSDLLLNSELVARAEISLAYFIVAMAAGFAVALAMSKPDTNPALPGVAITVALIPPLAASGAGFALAEWTIGAQALAVFGLNVAGIVLASLLVFLPTHIHRRREVARAAVAKEDKALEQEEETNE